MKKILCLLLLLITLASVVNCSSTKNKIGGSSTIGLPKDKTYLEEEDVYVPHRKSDRKTFFKSTAGEEKWVDSVYNQLSFNEKIGQLFMVAAYSNKDEEHFKTIEKLVTDQKIGGVIFFQGGPGRQAKLTNRFQSKSKVPLFVGIDAEWGLSMRLDSTYRFPWNMTLGAIKDTRIIEKLGAQMGKESRRIGVHFNFAPVIDVNTNPLNPIIGYRSFGEDKRNVTESAIALMTGVQNQGVFSTGKHFPGHGDTSTDSHHTLPVVTFSKERIENVELYPYKRMFDEGLESVMVAHLSVPNLEPRENLPTSLSYPVVTELLQNKMGFDGLIFTDALNMKGASSLRKPGDIDLEAFLAGNDILLFAENVPFALEKFTKAYADNLISDDRIEQSVKKILKYKFKVGLNKYKPIDTKTINSDINPAENNSLLYELYENAVTVIKNENRILPIKDLTNAKVAYIKLGDFSGSSFLSALSNYTEVTEIPIADETTLLERLSPFNTVIIGYHKSEISWWKTQEFSKSDLEIIEKIAVTKNVILDVFAKPYVLSTVQSIDKIKSIVVSYQNSEIAQVVSAEIIFGALGAKGRLPVSVGTSFKVNDGLETDKINVLGFTSPESVGMSSVKLNEIEKLANKAIDGKMAPGMQILVARKGKVIYQKSFGHHEYDKKTKVKNSDIYDVASVTKMVATLPNVMHLYDKGLVKLETKLGDMLPAFAASNKKDITFKELLSHYGRLPAWEPFYKPTLDADKCPADRYYSLAYREGFTKQVAENLYMRDDYQDTIMNKIINSKLIDKKEYKYSDFTFIILKDYIEKMTGQSLDILTTEHYFKPLGMNNTMYNPLLKFDMSVIPPTEDDTYFRHSKIQGYVHDMTAAMQGGVGGHAGVFSNSMDIAKMMQLFLQKGNYGGQQYFSPETMLTFNNCHFCLEGNRRGLGFDKPQLGKEGPTCGCVSKESFGHTGFTGTMAWADPETEIVYVFLSNRTFPDSNAPNTLSKQNIREDIQKIIQDAIIK
jgi:beta-N-acetylhexosaminidase